jgi:hypothetical protein
MDYFTTSLVVNTSHRKTATLIRNQLSLTRALVDTLEREIDQGSAGELEAKEKLEIARTALQSTHTSLVSINDFLTRPIKEISWTEGQGAPCPAR